jgi:hypothetical protein
MFNTRLSGVARVVECLPNKCEALSSNTRLTTKKPTKQQKLVLDYSEAEVRMIPFKTSPGK